MNLEAGYEISLRKGKPVSQENHLGAYAASKYILSLYEDRFLWKKKSPATRGKSGLTLADVEWLAYEPLMRTLFFNGVVVVEGFLIRTKFMIVLSRITLSLVYKSQIQSTVITSFIFVHLKNE